MSRARNSHGWEGSLLGLSCTGEVCLSRLMACHGNFLQSGEGWRFALCGVLTGIVYWVASSYFTRASLSRRGEITIFWIVAVALRLAILPVEPGDDLWRYRWEGMVQHHGFSPYEFSPDAPDLVHLRDAGWARINHRDFPAIYPPLAQVFFSVLAYCGNSVWLYKSTFLFTDLAICAVLRRLLLRSGMNEANAVWYAWNPLAVYAFAGAAHFDCLMILLLLLALWALDSSARDRSIDDQESIPATKNWLLWASALLLGLAAAIKIVPLALVPIWMIAAGSWRKAPLLLLLSVAPLAALAVAYGYPRVPVFSGLQSFGQSFRVNDPVWWAVDGPGSSPFLHDNTIIGLATVGAGLFITFAFRRDWRRALFWVWGTLLVLSPVVHAWYVVWILPIAVWRGASGQPWIILSISMFGYFILWDVNHASGRPWVEPVWLRLFIYVPAALGCAWSIYHRRPVLPAGEFTVSSNE